MLFEGDQRGPSKARLSLGVASYDKRGNLAYSLGVYFGTSGLRRLAKKDLLGESTCTRGSKPIDFSYKPTNRINGGRKGELLLSRWRESCF